MTNDKSVLAIIPARGGSKRLPKKNILPLGGKPLVVWTIEAGLNSTNIDRVVVSSDDEEILKVSVDAGAEIIHRPQEIASDEASSFSVIEHSINELNSQNNVIALLQPTSPMRNSTHIDEAIDLLTCKDADAVISVCETEHNPLWTNTLSEDGSMDKFIKAEIKGLRSQDLPMYYRLNGAIYLCKKEKLLIEKSFHLKQNTYAYIMEKEFSIDIDDKLDFDFAEYLSSRIEPFK